MNNLKISDRAIEFLKNVKYSIKRKVVSAGMVVGLSAMVLSGCGSNNSKAQQDYSLQEVYEIMDEKYGLENEFHLYGYKYNPGEIDKLLAEKYKAGEKNSCNDIISSVGNSALEQLIAEGYEIDKDKIENLNVIYFDNPQENVNKIDNAELGIEFEYEGEKYTIEADGNADSLARKLCTLIYAEENDELTLLEDETSIDYLAIPNATSVLKEALTAKLVPTAINHKKGYSLNPGGKQGYSYNGYFKLEKDKEKEKLVESKAEETAYNFDKEQKKHRQKQEKEEREYEKEYGDLGETNPDNKLPVKVDEDSENVKGTGSEDEINDIEYYEWDKIDEEDYEDEAEDEYEETDSTGKNM
ncbi:MAG: hypothetical protein IJ880_14095 [Bacilli bacterium]|nr:hypothetical protein [Bacilli bacterium]